MTYILDMVAIVNYNFALGKTCVTYILDTYILDMLANVNYNFVLVEDICYLHTGHLYTGHGSDREVQFCIGGTPM